MPALSPFNAVSRRVHSAPRRRGLSGVLQRVALVVVPRPHLPVPLLDAGRPETQAARERARRALLEARREMSGVIGISPSVDETAIVPAVMPDLERLQRYLEESERDRAALREEVSGLRGMLERVGAQIDLLQQTIAAMPKAPSPVEAPSSEAETEAPSEGGGDGAPAGETETEEVASEPLAAALRNEEGTSLAPTAEGEGPSTAAAPAQDRVVAEPDIAELRERVLRALRERVFAAGTVGTRIEISPSLPEAEAASVLARMNEEALVERAEEGPPAADATSVRVTLRAPLRWEQFSALLEAALGRPLPPGSVAWSHGVVRVNAASETAEPPGRASE